MTIVEFKLTDKIFVFTFTSYHKETKVLKKFLKDLNFLFGDLKF